MKVINRTKLVTKFPDQWVALRDDDRVISSGSTLERAVDGARKKGVANPVIAKIPSKI
jgi:hypothetical protein